MSSDARHSPKHPNVSMLIARGPAAPTHLRYEAIFQAAEFGIVVTDPRLPDNPIVDVNPAFSRMTGYAASEVIGRNCRLLQGAQTDRAEVAAMALAVAEGKADRRTLLNYRRDGGTFWNDLFLSPVHDSAGNLEAFIGVQTDVTAQVSEKARATSIERQLQGVADHIPGFVYQRSETKDGQPSLSFVGQSLNRMLEIPDGVVSTEAFLSHVHADDLEELLEAYRVSYETLTPSQTRYRLRSASGAEIWVRASCAPRHLGAGEFVWDGCGIDVSEEYAAHERLAWLTCHDALTGLVNRAGFEATVGARAQRCAPDEGLGVVAVDVHEVAAIRDALGESVADDLLRAIARRLERGLGDDGCVGRLGDGAFAVMRLLGTGNGSDFASRILEPLSEAFAIQGRRLSVRARGGVVRLPEHGPIVAASPAALGRELVKRAEIGLLVARGTDQERIATYSHDADQRFSNRVLLRQSLPHALELGQLTLEYQPLIELATMRVSGAEALVRWRHPQLGMQTPEAFIDLAEEAGLMAPLGEWVLGEAMPQAARWSDVEGAKPNLAVNVSGLQLSEGDFPATVRRALAETGLDPQNLELEFTESVLISQDAAAAAALGALRDLGVTLTADGFGADFSSFKFLKDMPVQKLKLGPWLIHNLAADKHGVSIVKAVMDMARSLHIQVTCAGIETRAQMDFVRGHGAKVGQGFYFSRALAADEFAWFLEERNLAAARRRRKPSFPNGA